jgi:formylglycine-generating enzyme required for sulfatase activity
MSADVAARLRQLAHDHHDGRLDLAAYRSLRAPLLESLVPNGGVASPVLEVTQPRAVPKPATQAPNEHEPKRSPKAAILIVAVVLVVAAGGLLVLRGVGVFGHGVSGGAAGTNGAGATTDANGADAAAGGAGGPGSAATAAGLNRILDLVGPFLDRGDWSDGRLTTLNAALLELGGAQIAVATRDARFQHFIDELRARLKEQQALAPAPLTADNNPLAALAVTVGIDLNSPDSALHVAPLPVPAAPESTAGGGQAEGGVGGGHRAAASGRLGTAGGAGSTAGAAPALGSSATRSLASGSAAPLAAGAATETGTATASSSAPSDSVAPSASNTYGTRDGADVRDARDAHESTCTLDLIRSRRPLCHDTLQTGVEGPPLALIPAGSFDMGSTAAPEERPVHRVMIQQPFAISVYEVSQGEFKQYCEHAKRPCAPQPWSGDDFPVVNVSWDDARAYTDWLSEVTHHHYSLPTEAQWEYAARGGRTGLFPSGDALSATDAQFSGLTKQIVAARRSQSFNANAFRLLHTVGNVREWVEDSWVQSFVGAPGDGSAVKSIQSTSRVVRGGSYADGATRLRLSMREGLPLGTRDVTTGFRIARELP